MIHNYSEVVIVVIVIVKLNLLLQVSKHLYTIEILIFYVAYNNVIKKG